MFIAGHCGALRGTAGHCGALRGTAGYCGALRDTVGYSCGGALPSHPLIRSPLWRFWGTLFMIEISYDSSNSQRRCYIPKEMLYAQVHDPKGDAISSGSSCILQWRIRTGRGQLLSSCKTGALLTPYGELKQHPRASPLSSLPSELKQHPRSPTSSSDGRLDSGDARPFRRILALLPSPSESESSSSATITTAAAAGAAAAAAATTSSSPPATTAISNTQHRHNNTRRMMRIIDTPPPSRQRSDWRFPFSALHLSRG